MTMSGFLLRLGTVDFLPVYIVLMAADLTGDCIWYAIGYYYARPFARKYGHFIGLTENALAKTEHVFQKYHNRILFLSKITMGFGFALVVLVTAGMTRVPFKKYFAFNALGEIIWTGFLLAIGYFYGNVYLTINKDLRWLSLGVFIVILLGIFYGLNRFLKMREMQDQL